MRLGNLYLEAMTMTENMNLTEKELEYINSCTIDTRGRLVMRPARPMPSLYSKGVISKAEGEDAPVVSKEFRPYFVCQADLVDGMEACTEEVEDLDAELKDLAKQLKRKSVGKDELNACFEIFRAMMAKTAIAKQGEERAQTASNLGSRRAWHKDLAAFVGKVFDCEVEFDGGLTMFEGQAHEALGAKHAYELAWKAGNRIAQREYDDYLAKHGQAVGIYAECAAAVIDEFYKALAA